MKDTSELVASLLADMTRQVGGGEYYLYTRVRYIRSEKEGRAYICESDYKATYAGASQIGVDL